MRRAFVVGSGPNGLTAAIILAKAGVEVTVLEAQPTFGGGTRSAELTLPSFIHDVCSAVHPLAISSPVFNSFPLAEHGLRWIHPPTPLAHVLDDGKAVLMERSLEQTAERLEKDGRRWRQILQPFAEHWKGLCDDILAPIHWPAHPFFAGAIWTSRAASG